MTREKEITKEAKKFAKEIDDWEIAEDAFEVGARWADQHPHWISVEDEMPPIGDIVLVAIPCGGELSVLPLSIKNESDFECLSGMTHWMPLPKIPVLSKSGNTGKDLKGGEE